MYKYYKSKLLPTVLIIGPYRFFFYSGDREEPKHIHIERDDKIAKFWIDPVRLQVSGGFSRVELDKIQKLVIANNKIFKETWDAYFNN